MESEINQLEDEIFGILRDLENLTAGMSIRIPHTVTVQLLQANHIVGNWVVHVCSQTKCMPNDFNG